MVRVPIFPHLPVGRMAVVFALLAEPDSGTCAYGTCPPFCVPFLNFT